MRAEDSSMAKEERNRQTRRSERCIKEREKFNKIILNIFSISDNTAPLIKLSRRK